LHYDHEARQKFLAKLQQLDPGHPWTRHSAPRSSFSASCSKTAYR
jgi:hypothetical protein